MRVLITGGTGLIGKATAERLLQHGWEVRSFDLKPPADNPNGGGVAVDGVEYVQGDILRYEELLPALEGCDAAIHMAALRGPSLAAGQDVYHVNVQGTFNLFEAAAVTGIKRVVQASSINALGCFYGTDDIDVRYLPVDEDHPTNTTDPYSFSKQTIESIGAYYWRRDGISSVAFRYPGVHEPAFTHSERFIQRQINAKRLLDAAAAVPADEWRARIADLRLRSVAFRCERPFEYPQQSLQHQPPSAEPTDEELLFRAYTFDRTNFWAFIDVRDAALANECALTADYEGAHPLFVNDTSNYLNYDARTLARLFFPEVTDLRGDLDGAAALVSIDKARALIGFEPEYSLATAGQA